MEPIMAYSVKEKKKVELTESIEFRQSPNGSYMIKGKSSEGATLTTMMGKANAQKYIDEGMTVVKEFSY